ncbi:unnamed protein product [Darwinula stevensoni]|uniref:Sialin n=1 Tax=Darwinula stevensoni TaxID=69355 RepID=A0A7R8X5M4_9CRUS|nr:unnamed protein product [Darwinula stevensoni]CAG0884828.1 unnamed protein product [Darwinula stevensoni]
MPPKRYIVAVLAFLGFCNVYMLRVNLSIAIVAMTNNHTISLPDNSVAIVQDFDWDSKMRGIILSSFFYGYIMTQIPGGYLSARLGGRLLFGLGIFMTGLFTLLTPLVARISVGLLITIRILEGLFEGVTYPSIHAVWSHWAPPAERSKLVTIAFSGSYIGTVIAMPLSGLIADHAGWPVIFYFFGIVAIVWSLLWWLVVRDSPFTDPSVTPEELQLYDEQEQYIEAKVETPWRQILTSLPVWAIIVAHFSENWGFYTLLTQLPSFMNGKKSLPLSQGGTCFAWKIHIIITLADVLGFNLDQAGFLSALPYLVMAIVVQSGGHIADALRSHAHPKFSFSTTKVRKIMTCTAFLSQTVFMLLAAYIMTPTAAVTFLTISVGLGGFAWSGFSVNHLDVAPQFASILMGLSNCFATVPGIVSPTLTGIIVPDKSAGEWQMVFIIAAGIYLCGALFYGMFASGEKQKWAELYEDAGFTLTQGEHNHGYDATATVTPPPLD